MSAANFAPYQPPPDEDPARPAPAAPTGTPSPVPSVATAPSRPAVSEYRASLDDPDPRYATESYQSGAPPSGSPSRGSAQAQSQGQIVFDAPADSLPSYRVGQNAAPSWGAPAGPAFSAGMGGVTRPDPASYASSRGYSISALCAAAWAAPPFSSVAILVWETENDLARFHAYQSGLCGVTLILALWILRSWFGWYTISVLVGMGSIGWFWASASNAHRAAPTLARVPYLPYFGELSDRWVGEE